MVDKTASATSSVRKVLGVGLGTLCRPPYVSAVLNGMTWQRCTVHFARNVCAFLPKSAQGLVGAALSNVFKHASYKEAQDAMSKVLAPLKRHPKAAEVARLAEDGVLALCGPEVQGIGRTGPNV